MTYTSFCCGRIEYDGSNIQLIFFFFSEKKYAVFIIIRFWDTIIVWKITTIWHHQSQFKTIKNGSNKFNLNHFKSDTSIQLMIVDLDSTHYVIWRKQFSHHYSIENSRFRVWYMAIMIHNTTIFVAICVYFSSNWLENIWRNWLEIEKWYLQQT